MGYGLIGHTKLGLPMERPMLRGKFENSDTSCVPVEIFDEMSQLVKIAMTTRLKSMQKQIFVVAPITLLPL